MSIEECQQYVDKIISSKYVQRTWNLRGTERVRVYAGRGGGKAYHSLFGAGHITLGVWARQEAIVIHEVAHLLAGGTRHNWQFCETYLKLVRHFMGKEAHDRLKASFKQHRVKYTKPRQKRVLSPEQKAILVERAAKARAVRQANLAKKVDQS
ncbi:MAG: hypothetical protein ACO3VQ_02465 [Ilumatobacteraceae bacterium]